ncbi:hybrid sensor histidine kinase/response regulator [Hydrogenophaga laconesensis]|uniref:histidine kinase n=1 Tax=Hydrogenophaga laconesensis TaxID=1805971 RepID=A0ABU1VHF3_9BURK|nr:PAS domain-containing sensor histidine kinase [Hydrogenophaga laconesensis]MDR7096911.1 PAS domain S-box-containing protein [Hydrogenophaga laconesensis]
MLFDLPTLLAVRVGVDVLIALAFAGLLRRYPTIRGPGWWSLAALVSILGSLGLWMRGSVPDFLSYGIGNVALSTAPLIAWLGLRSHLQFQQPASRVALAALLVLVLQIVFHDVWDLPRARQAVFATVVLAAMALAYRDMVRADAQRRVPEIQALKWLTAVEFAAMVAFAVAAPLGGLPLSQVGPVTVFFYLLAGLLRVVLYGALVTYRLRVDGDRARQGLLIREADSRALIENLSAGVMVFRPNHTLSSINSAARRFFGWSPGGANTALPEPTGPGWRMLREDGQPMRRHDMPFERVLATGQPVKSVVVGVPVGGSGEVRWALFNAYPENNAQGGLRHVVLTFIDITSLKSAQAEQKTLQAQLSQSQKMEALGTLAGGVAHDFNNILAAILGNADLARQDLTRDAPARESLHEISTAARRGRELVRQILAFSRQQPVERTRVDVSAILSETCNLMRAALPPHAQLLHEAHPDTPDMLADATQIGQVLINLGTNAVHALEGRPGRVECQLDGLAGDDPRLPAEVARACAEGGVRALRLRVSDNGCGMTDAVRSRIFEPFFTTRVVGRGTGLGLPVVLGIVQVHGGTIDVASEPGKGTTFTLYFPAAPDGPVRAPVDQAVAHAPADPVTMAPCPPDGTETAPMETPPMADAQPADQPHILYLDDDDTLVFLVRRLLERRGYRVTSFTDQQQAIKAVREQPQAFHLLLTDYNMPGMSGLDVARAALAINPQLPVAVASGYITDELQAEAKVAGVREVVFKTDAVEAFCEVVARLVRTD